MIAAHLDSIDPRRVAWSHELEEERVEELVLALRAGAALPAPLVVEDGGNGYLILDGHHRIEAHVRLGTGEIDAYTVGLGALEALLEAEFGGELPGRLSDLDEYITIDGRPYAGRHQREEA